MQGRGDSACKLRPTFPFCTETIFYSLWPKRMTLLTNHRLNTHPESASLGNYAPLLSMQLGQSLLNSVIPFQDTQCGKTMICIAHLTVGHFQAAPPIVMENLNQLSWPEGQLCYQALHAAYFPWMLVFSNLTPGAADLTPLLLKSSFSFSICLSGIQVSLLAYF